MPTCSRRALARRLSKIVLVATLGFVSTATPAAWAEEPGSSGCADLTLAVHQYVDPTSQAMALSASTEDSAGLIAAGYTADRGVMFWASPRAGAGLRAVHVLHRSTSGDYLYTTSSSEVRSAMTRYGYQDKGTSFYVPQQRRACTSPFYRYRSGVRHLLAATPELANASGARGEGIAFYAAMSPTPEATSTPDGDSFTLAVIPSTQQEVLSDGDNRWTSRTAWLAEHQADLNLRFVTDTGDVANWGNVDPQQFQRAKKALGTLTAARIPYSLALGNHDTAAVCTGGSACDPAKTTTLVRDTSAFNSAFTAAGFGAVGGQFEAGKVDNSFSTFVGGGKKWLVLTLEMYPRRAAVAWAQKVVAAHPEHNVIVVTHQYTTAAGAIDSSAGYGQSSARYVFDQLVSRYPNIRVVLNGHAGRAAFRTDRGKAGNTVYTFGVHLHDVEANPVQLLSINTADGTLRSRVYAPSTGQTYTDFGHRLTGVRWV